MKKLLTLLLMVTLLLPLHAVQAAPKVTDAQFKTLLTAIDAFQQATTTHQDVIYRLQPLRVTKGQIELRDYQLNFTEAEAKAIGEDYHNTKGFAEGTMATVSVKAINQAFALIPAAMTPAQKKALEKQLKSTTPLTTKAKFTGQVATHLNTITNGLKQLVNNVALPYNVKPKLSPNKIILDHFNDTGFAVDRFLDELYIRMLKEKRPKMTDAELRKLVAELDGKYEEAMAKYDKAMERAYVNLQEDASHLLGEISYSLQEFRSVSDLDRFIKGETISEASLNDIRAICKKSYETRVQLLKELVNGVK